MVINDFDMLRSRCRPMEADTELIVHSDTVLTSSVGLERFESVPRRNTEILQSSRDLQLTQLASSDTFDPLKSLDPSAARECLSIGVPKRYDHSNMITYDVVNVTRDYSGQNGGRSNKCVKRKRRCTLSVNY